jgi:hypothetical protein
MNKLLLNLASQITVKLEDYDHDPFARSDSLTEKSRNDLLAARASMPGFRA